jgi:hypothetical protein
MEGKTMKGKLYRDRENNASFLVIEESGYFFQIVMQGNKIMIGIDTNAEPLGNDEGVYEIPEEISTAIIILAEGKRELEKRSNYLLNLMTLPDLMADLE